MKAIPDNLFDHTEFFVPIKKNPLKKPLQALLMTVFLILLALGVSGSVYAYLTISDILSTAPALDSVTVAPTEAATYICDQSGKHVQKLTLPEANRDLVSISRIPEQLQHAFVAIEDSRYYTHNGIDIPGIFRAAWVGVTSGDFSEGASTITQQLLKNSVFTGWTQETTFQQRLKRKIQEQYLAIQLEKIMTKDQILQDYLNTINLGAGCYGVQAAAYRYFGKDVSELTLSESAVIASITQNPTLYNPITYPENNADRRSIVLRKMLEQKYISRSEYEEALSDDVYSRIQSNEDSLASASSIYTYYQDALIEQVLNDLMDEKGYTYKQAYKAVYTGGLRIYSAQDDVIQKICTEEFANPDNFPEGTEAGIDYALSVESPGGQITHYGNQDLLSFVRSSGNPDFNLMYASSEEAKTSAAAFRASVLTEEDTVLGERITITPQPQASVVVIEQDTGYVRAVVGGRGNKDASLTLNRATYTTRQPGSTFKILTTYAPAIDACGQTLATLYANRPYAYWDGTPVGNWDLNDYSDTVTMRDAIIRSVNVAAVECITDITPQLGYDYGVSFGISTLVDQMSTDAGLITDIVQPLALGGITNGVTNLELCAAYSCIANQGSYIVPKFYTKVLDQAGNVLLDNTHPAGRTIIKESTAYLLTDAMKGVISDPTGTGYGLINLGNMPVAGKSGTTENYKDIWFTGYTPYYTCSVWGGYDNNEYLPDDALAHTYCKVLWNSIMNRIHKSLPAVDFPACQGLIHVNICRETGLMASAGCPSYNEVFLAGTQPTLICNAHLDKPSAPDPVFTQTGLVRTGESAEQTQQITDAAQALQTVDTVQTQPAAGRVQQANSDSGESAQTDADRQTAQTGTGGNTSRSAGQESSGIQQSSGSLSASPRITVWEGDSSSSQTIAPVQTALPSDGSDSTAAGQDINPSASENGISRGADTASPGSPSRVSVPEETPAETVYGFSQLSASAEVSSGSSSDTRADDRVYGNTRSAPADSGSSGNTPDTLTDNISSDGNTSLSTDESDPADTGSFLAAAIREWNNPASGSTASPGRAASPGSAASSGTSGSGTGSSFPNASSAPFTITITDETILPEGSNSVDLYGNNIWAGGDIYGGNSGTTGAGPSGYGTYGSSDIGLGSPEYGTYGSSDIGLGSPEYGIFSSSDIGLGSSGYSTYGSSDIGPGSPGYGTGDFSDTQTGEDGLTAAQRQIYDQIPIAR